jgi:peptide/nickel transport system substrate-binding protein
MRSTDAVQAVSSLSRERRVAVCMAGVWRPVARIVATALVAVSVAGTISCSAHDPTEAVDSDPGISDNPINEKPAGSLRNGGVLRLPMSQFPQNFNPLLGGLDYLEMAKAMYPRVYTTTSDGTLTLNTDYFRSVEATGENPLVLTYTINPQATWTDGTPITWEDISSQVHAMSGADPRFMSPIKTGFDRVASVVRGVDDRQAVMTFKSNYPEWQGLFAGNGILLPRSMTANPSAFNEGQRSAPGPSAGPFIISQIDQAGQGLTLTANPKWWGTRPRLEAITYSAMYVEDQVQALRDGRIDTGRITSDYDLADVRSVDGIAIRRAPELRWSALSFNGAPGTILEDKRLRLAIAEAIDRESIVNVQLHGLVANPVTVNNHIFMPSQRNYQDDAGALPYNPDQARRDLDDLGWTLHGAVREKSGKQLVIRDVFFYTNADYNVARLVQLDLEKVGVKMIIDSDPDEGFLRAGAYDVTQDQNSSDVFPLSTVDEMFHSNQVANPGKIGSQDIDAQIEHALNQPDEDTALLRANEIDQMIWAEGHSLPLSQSPGVVAVRSTIANYGAFSLADIDYKSIGFTA